MAKLRIIPGDAVIGPKGNADWHVGELSVRIWLHPDDDGDLRWRCFVGDARLGPRMSEFGSLAVAIDPVDDRTIPWPVSETLTADHQAFLADGIGAAQRFVTGRRDLAEILASEDNIVRGHLTTWLLRANYPARLVQALIIANDSGFADLAERIRERLRGGPTILPSGRPLEIMESARYWAREYGKALHAKIVL